MHFDLDLRGTSPKLNFRNFSMANGELYVSERPGVAPLEITGSGIVGVKLLTHAHLIDLDINRLDDRWCFLPIAAP